MTSALERLGRRIVVDTGFGAFLEKFEEHFGKATLKGLLLLIGMATALFCGKMIWDIALSPLINAITEVGLAKTLLNLIWMGIAFSGGAAVGAALYVAFMTWKLDRRLARSEKISKEHISRLDRIEAEVDARLKQLNQE